MKRMTLIITFIVALLLAAIAGYSLSNFQKKSASTEMPDSLKVSKSVLYWYDPMVPDQRFDKPGKSPFMDMQLVPKYKDEAGNESGVVIPSLTLQNLGIRLAKVEKRQFGDDLSAVGRIEPDERRFYLVQTKVSGFVERLNVRAIGDPVSKGQKLAEVYAPELLAAQQEYLALLDYDGVSVTAGLAQAARNRLKLLGMTESEIANISKNKAPNSRFGIYAPASGVVTELGVRDGGQLIPGSSLMQITDLSSVWLMGEIPERDVARINLGANAELVLQGLPEQVFKGKVGYLYPTLDETSRTLRVRIELPNPHGVLRPGMFGNIKIAGKSYEALGVPAESVIETGKRKVVIVKEENGFRPVEIETGQRNSNFIEISKGLTVGEQVVISGQFLIDSEASLSGVLARLSQQAQASSDKPTMSIDTAADSAPKMPQSTGMVIDIDPKTAEITLAHEAIAELGWPAMTMGFKLKDAKQLQTLKPGDMVKFDLKANGEDQYIIEHIEKQPAKLSSGAGAKP